MVCWAGACYEGTGSGRDWVRKSGHWVRKRVTMSCGVIMCNCAEPGCEGFVGHGEDVQNHVQHFHPLEFSAESVRVVIFFSTTSTHKNHKKLKVNNLPTNNVRVVHKSITTSTPNTTKPLISNTLHFTHVRVITKSITTRTPNTAKPLILNTLHFTHVRVAFRSV